MGEVKILGLESNNYLAMNAEGQLYAEEDGSNESTIFIEKTHGSYLVYLRYLWTILSYYVQWRSEYWMLKYRKYPNAGLLLTQLFD